MKKGRPSRKINREEVYAIIKRKWPAHVTEVAEAMHLLAKQSSAKERKQVLAHLKYHFDQLAREGKIKVKKIGMALVAWPSEMERMRVIHDIFEM
ncbi:MAG: hypothetical protein QXR53_04355 [Candidatus Norongarragalinales archaeon]